MTDGAPLLARIDVPTLVIIGKKDIQVDLQSDGERLQHAAAGRADITFLFPNDANHVLKHESRPRSELNAAQAVSSYNAPEATLDSEAMASTIQWLAARA